VSTETPVQATAVVDANIILSLALPLPFSSQASTLFAGLCRYGLKVVVPALMEYEVCCAPRRAVTVGVLSEAEARHALDMLHDLELRPISPTPSLHRRALLWAARLNHTKAYDAAYPALAEELGCNLYTGDQRPAAAARGCGAVWVHAVTGGPARIQTGPWDNQDDMNQEAIEIQMDTLSERLAALARRYSLLAVYVFGSRATEIAERVGVGSGGEAAASTVTSDVDIGVQPDWKRRLSAAERVELTLALESELGVPRVDLVVLPEVNPFLAAEVVRGELLFARDQIEESELQLYYLRRAGDLAPFFREHWRDVVGSEL